MAPLANACLRAPGFFSAVTRRIASDTGGSRATPSSRFPDLNTRGILLLNAQALLLRHPRRRRRLFFPPCAYRRFGHFTNGVDFLNASVASLSWVMKEMRGAPFERRLFAADVRPGDAVSERPAPRTPLRPSGRGLINQKRLCISLRVRFFLAQEKHDGQCASETKRTSDKSRRMSSSVTFSHGCSVERTVVRENVKWPRNEKYRKPLASGASRLIDGRGG